MIEIKNSDEIKLIEKACKITAETLLLMKENAKIGVSTLYLDEIAYRNILKNNAKPAFFGYRGYPKTSCISINEEVIHGIPSQDKIIKNGDVVSIDLGVVYDGYYGDAATTFIVGTPKDHSHIKLVEVCYNALNEGIGVIREGVRLGDVSYAIGSYVFKNKMSVLKNFTGHGIGRRLHEEPSIFNFGIKGTGPLLRNGMTLAIEPMITLGSGDVYIKEDNWTVITSDGSYAAHFEHTVLVTENGARILTKI